MMNKKASHIEKLYSRQLFDKNIIIAEQAKEIKELKETIGNYSILNEILDNKLEHLNTLVTKLGGIIPKF